MQRYFENIKTIIYLKELIAKLPPLYTNLITLENAYVTDCIRMLLRLWHGLNMRINTLMAQT